MDYAGMQEVISKEFQSPCRPLNFVLRSQNILEKTVYQLLKRNLNVKEWSQQIICGTDLKMYVNWKTKEQWIFFISTECFQNEPREKAFQRYSKIYYNMTNSYRPGIKKFDWFKAGL